MHAQVGRVTIERIGEPVPIAVAGDRRHLSPAALKEIHELMVRDPWHFIAHLAANWLLIAGAIATAVWFQHWLICAAAIVFIGTRQNVLGVLLHEQVHRSAFQSPFAEHLTNLTVAYPLGLSVEGYRRVHLAHHQHFFTDRDPDFARKQGVEWTFPQRARRLLRSFLSDIASLNLWKTIKSKRMGDSAASPQTLRPGSLLQPLFYGSVAVALSLTNAWASFLLYWVLPWATVLQAIVRWAAICEHRYNLVHPSVAEATPMIILRPWERLLLPNLNFTTYHVYHHYFPKVPCAMLPRVHEVFRREGLVRDEAVFRGYWSFLRYLLLGCGPETGACRTAAGQAGERAPVSTSAPVGDSPTFPRRLPDSEQQESETRQRPLRREECHAGNS